MQNGAGLIGADYGVRCVGGVLKVVEGGIITGQPRCWPLLSYLGFTVHFIL